MAQIEMLVTIEIRILVEAEDSAEAEEALRQMDDAELYEEALGITYEYDILE